MPRHPLCLSVVVFLFALPAAATITAVAGTYTATPPATTQNGNGCAGAPWTPTAPASDSTTQIVLSGSLASPSLNMRNVGNAQLPKLTYPLKLVSQSATSVEYEGGGTMWFYSLCDHDRSSPSFAQGRITLKEVSGGVLITGQLMFTATIPACHPYCSTTFRDIYNLNHFQGVMTAPTITFTASPSTITAGESSTLSWNVQNATSVSIDHSIGAVTSSGTRTVSPATTTTYTLTATGTGGSATAQATVTVNPCAAIQAGTLTIAYTGIQSGCTPTTLCSAGEAIRFSAQISGRGVQACDQLAWDFGDGSSPATDQQPAHTYAMTGQYTVALRVTNPNGTTSASTIVKVQGSGVLRFDALPSTIAAGSGSTLSWSTNGQYVTIDNGIGRRDASGSVTVLPAHTTVFTLTTNYGATASVTVNVIETPLIEITRYPSGMLQVPGASGATDSYVVTNVGGSVASITLSQSASFFAQAPTVFTLRPGDVQTVTITAGSGGSGVLTGESIVQLSGGAAVRVPIRLGVVAASPGSSASALDRRVDTSSSGPASGVARFANTGSTMLQAAAVSSAPWLIPDSSVITIQPGETTSVRFTIDRSKRGDASASIGSLSGSLSLLYFGGSSAGGSLRLLDATIPPNVSTVTVVDTASPVVSTTALPPLRSGEIALLIPALGHVQGSVGVFASDLSLLHLGSAPAALQLYFTPAGSGAATMLASIPSLSSGLGVLLSDVVKNVFGVSQLGTVQIRGTDVTQLSAAAGVLNISGAKGTYGSAIPVFRSDRAAGAGETMVLTGLHAEAGMHTNMYVQEASGNYVDLAIEFFSAGGQSVGIRPLAMGPFELAQLGGIVPRGAVSAILTGGETTTGKFVAYATPVDEASGDTWTIVDWSRYYGSERSDIVVPVAGTAHGANNTYFRTEFAATNTSTSNGTALVRFRSSTGAVLDGTLSIGPRQTVIYDDILHDLFNTTADGVGALTVTRLTGEFAVTSRTYSTTASQAGTFGTGVPALPDSAKLRLGSAIRLAGLHDAALESIAAARAGTFRTNFGLVETGGDTVKVRVTMQYTFPAGVKVSGIASAYVDYILGPNQFIMINGVSSQLLQSLRQKFGDLSNVEVDVQVLEGNGGVNVFASSVDNGSSDAILRTE